MDDIDELSQSERAYRVLRREILHGDVMPGERLRAADLQDRYDLGLTPIREALMRLTSESLVEGEANRGSRARDVSIAELHDLMATRREIERMCLAASISRGDAQWEAEIVASLHLLTRVGLPASDADRDTAAQWETLHRRFHTALIAACGSPWQLRFWNTLVDHSERYRKVRLMRHREERAEVRDAHAEHAAIADAVLKRDAEHAIRLMEEHLMATENTVARLLEAGARDDKNRSTP